MFKPLPGGIPPRPRSELRTLEKVCSDKDGSLGPRRALQRTGREKPGRQAQRGNGEAQCSKKHTRLLRGYPISETRISLRRHEAQGSTRMSVLKASRCQRINASFG